MQKQLIIAHRGESWIAPENTLSAVKLAWENGADAVEIDVRLTKDNKIVVIHDANTRRVSGKWKRISNTNLKELKKLDVGRYKDIKYQGEKIPTLHEVLSTVPKGRKILIEIKSSCKIVPYLKEVIFHSGLDKDQVEIISFNFKTLIEVRKQLPKYNILWVSALNYGKRCKFLHRPIDKIIEKALKFEMHGVDLWTGDLLTAEMVKNVKATGLKLYVWTINNPEKARNLFIMGVDGIATDRAVWIREQLGIKKIQ